MFEYLRPIDANGQMLSLLAEHAVLLGLRDGRIATTPMSMPQLMKEMGITEMPQYSAELRRIYGAAVKMQRKLKNGGEHVRKTKG
jgi:hypothetical protein